MSEPINTRGTNSSCNKQSTYTQYIVIHGSLWCHMCSTATMIFFCYQQCRTTKVMQSSLYTVSLHVNKQTDIIPLGNQIIRVCAQYHYMETNKQTDIIPLPGNQIIKVHNFKTYVLLQCIISQNTYILSNPSPFPHTKNISLGL